MAKRRSPSTSLSAIGVFEDSVCRSKQTCSRVNAHIAKRKAPVVLTVGSGEKSASISVRGESRKSLKLPLSLSGERAKLIALMRDLISQLPALTFDLESAVARCEKCPVENEEFAGQAVAAWCEITDQKVPSQRELIAARIRRTASTKKICRQFVKDIRNRAPC